ncbi:MAG: aminoacyl-tRNA hydrolase [Deltaproteobacteria bacterium]|jgi:PTH1 family peptidyl-tRNA hydrolase|nr:aminoacyl-tRNA hydrolase [Deltaproteobacteria bacterium]
MEASGTKLIMGLGNPGPAYADNRHNVGFMALDLFAREGLDGAGPPANFKSSLIVTGAGRSGRVILAWPQTYMNLSGHAARELVSFYKISAAEDLLVVHDEMDLPCGRVKATRGGGSAGHNGIDSVKEAVPADFARLRIGIGRPPKDLWGASPGSRDYVLSPFEPEENPLVEEALKAARELMAVWLKDGLSAAQRLGNRRPPKPKAKKGGEGEGKPGVQGEPDGQGQAEGGGKPGGQGQAGPG